MLKEQIKEELRKALEEAFDEVALKDVESYDSEEVKKEVKKDLSIYKDEMIKTFFERADRTLTALASSGRISSQEIEKALESKDALEVIKEVFRKELQESAFLAFEKKHFKLVEEHHELVIRSLGTVEKHFGEALGKTLVKLYKILQEDLTRLKKEINENVDYTRSKVIGEIHSSSASLSRDVTKGLWGF